MVKFQIWILPVIFVLTACGGGGGSASDTGDSASIPKQISWVAPSHNTDDTLLSDLMKYRFYYGPDASSLKVIPELDLDAAGGSVTSLNISSLSAANLELLTNLLKDNTSHFFAMTAVNSQNIESSFSNIASYP